MEPVPTLLLRPEQCAQATNLSRTVIYELLATGELESVRVGRSRRVPAAALESFVERLREQQAAHR